MPERTGKGAYRFIWTKKAVHKFFLAGYDAAHTISNIANFPDGFVRQMPRGCPWIVVDADDGVVWSGEGPHVDGGEMYVDV